MEEQTARMDSLDALLEKIFDDDKPSDDAQCSSPQTVDGSMYMGSMCVCMPQHGSFSNECFEHVNEDVERLRQRLDALKEGDILENNELEMIAKNIQQFTQEELLKIPNIYIRGMTHYPLQLSKEIMTSLKLVSMNSGIWMHNIILPFLTDKHCNCYCDTKSTKQCNRKRRFGELTCSRHISSEMTPSEYVYKMNKMENQKSA